ncbi:hypothetical protein GCM10020218_082340 [Dactylosporangium vinaceum]
MLPGRPALAMRRLTQRPHRRLARGTCTNRWVGAVAALRVVPLLWVLAEPSSFRYDADRAVSLTEVIRLAQAQVNTSAGEQRRERSPWPAPSTAGPDGDQTRVGGVTTCPGVVAEPSRQPDASTADDPDLTGAAA